MRFVPATEPALRVGIPERTRRDVTTERNPVLPTHLLRVLNQMPPDDVRDDVTDEVTADALDHQRRLLQVLKKATLDCLAASQVLPDLGGVEAPHPVTASATARKAEVRFVGLSEPLEEAHGSELVADLDGLDDGQEERANEVIALLRPFVRLRAKGIRADEQGRVTDDVDVNEVDLALVTVQLEVISNALRRRNDRSHAHGGLRAHARVHAWPTRTN